MAALEPSRLWLDSLRPTVGDDGALMEVTAIVNVAYRDDETGEEIVRSRNVASFSMMTPEQVAGVQAIYQGMVDALKSQYGVA